MKEVKLLKDLGLKQHLHLAGYVLLVSFIVKIFYQNHIQKFISDVSEIFRQIPSRISESFRPYLYEILTKKAKKVFDVVEATCSYLVSIFSQIYLVIFLVFSKNILWNDFSIEKGFMYFISMLAFFSLSLAFITNGNKAVCRIRKNELAR